MNGLQKRAAILTVAAAVFAGCSDDSGSTKAGGSEGPVTLRIGTAELPTRAAADQIDEFVRQVQERSDGQLLIEPVWDAVKPGQDDWDQFVARMVVSGELEMGLIPARAWDTEGVTSLRALHAPFLVTSDELVEEIVTGELAGEMLAGLDAISITGLALLPEGLRHVFAFEDPMVAPADFDGATIRAPRSATTYALFEALGARVDDFTSGFDEGVAAGSVSAAESSFGLMVVSPPPAPVTATGNVTFFPKVNSLVMNSETFDDLTDEQRSLLSEAAEGTLIWSLSNTPRDVDLARRFCEGFGGVVIASDADVAALERAAASVYEDIAEDDVTGALIDGIRELKEKLPAPDPIAPCDGPVPNDDEAATTDPSGDSIVLEGVYRYDATYEHLIDAGFQESLAREEGGVHTVTIGEGLFTDGWGDDECSGTYVISGRSVTFRWTSGCTGDWTMTAAIDGDQIEWSEFEALPPYDDAESQLIVEGFYGVPWTKVG